MSDVGAGGSQGDGDRRNEGWDLRGPQSRVGSR